MVRGWWLVAVALLVGTAEAGPLTLSEVLYDAEGADDGGTFVELHGPAGLLLDGYWLEGVNGNGGGVTHRVLLDGLRIPGDGFLVLADGTATGESRVSEADAWFADLDLQNGPDSVRLLRGGSVLDALGYGVFGEGAVFAGEGRAAPDAAAGESLARWYADRDTDDNARDFGVAEEPSPGRGPRWTEEVGIPESASVGLLGLGFGMVAVVLARTRVSRAGSRRRRCPRSP